MPPVVHPQACGGAIGGRARALGTLASAGLGARVLGGRVPLSPALLRALLRGCVSGVAASLCSSSHSLGPALVARPSWRPTPPRGPRLPPSLAKRGSQTTGRSLSSLSKLLNRVKPPQTGIHSILETKQ